MKYANDPDYMHDPMPAIETAAAELSTLIDEMAEMLDDFRSFCGDKLYSENAEVKYFASDCYTLTGKALYKLDQIHDQSSRINSELKP